MTRDVAEVFSRWRRWSHPRAISIASATTRWLAAIDLHSDHPPSGDGGYRKIEDVRSDQEAKACVDTLSVALIDSQRHHAVVGCDRSPLRSSTIWRWWLQTGLHRSPYRSSTIWRWIATKWVALATTPIVASATVHESPCDGLPPPDAMRPNSTQPPDLG